MARTSETYQDAPEKMLLSTQNDVYKMRMLSDIEEYERRVSEADAIQTTPADAWEAVPSHLPAYTPPPDCQAHSAQSLQIEDFFSGETISIAAPLPSPATTTPSLADNGTLQTTDFRAANPTLSSSSSTTTEPAQNPTKRRRAESSSSSSSSSSDQQPPNGGGKTRPPPPPPLPTKRGPGRPRKIRPTPLLPERPLGRPRKHPLPLPPTPCAEHPSDFSTLRLLPSPHLLTSPLPQQHTHAGPTRACSNIAAHPHQPHIVCAHCRHLATAAIEASHPDLLPRRSMIWPLCGPCGDVAVGGKPCECGERWECWACQAEGLERARARDQAEAEWRLGHGWGCRCGAGVGVGGESGVCVGCGGVGRVGGGEGMEERMEVLRREVGAWA